MKALEKDRPPLRNGQRSLPRTFEHYLEDEPVEACPPSTAYRFRKFAKRNKSVMTTAAILTAAILLGSGISAWQAVRIPRSEAGKCCRAVSAATLHTGNSIPSTGRTIATRCGAGTTTRRKSTRIAERMEASASENLNLALTALDDIYLTAVGEERLLAAASVDNADPSHIADLHGGFSEQERDLLQRGLQFYQRLAGGNSKSESALRRKRKPTTALLFYIQDWARFRARPAFRVAITGFQSLTINGSPDASDWSELAKSRTGLAATLDGLNKERKSILEAAEEDCTKAIQLNPEDASRYVERGHIRNLLNSAAALRDFETAAQLEPDNATHHKILASHYGNLCDDTSSRLRKSNSTRDTCHGIGSR